MKHILILFLFFSFTCQAQTILKNGDTLNIQIGDTLTGSMSVQRSDSTETGDYRKGTVSYYSKSYSKVKVVEEKKNEKAFSIIGLKLGTSLITVGVTREDGVALRAYFYVTVNRNTARQPVRVVLEFK